MNRAEILQKAIECVTKDRNATHGEPEDSFKSIADLWSAYLGQEITSHDVGMLMVLFKVARAKANPDHKDNHIDGAGYFACAGGLPSDRVVYERMLISVQSEGKCPRGFVIKGGEYEGVHCFCILPPGHEGPHVTQDPYGKVEFS